MSNKVAFEAFHFTLRELLQDASTGSSLSAPSHQVLSILPRVDQPLHQPSLDARQGPPMQMNINALEFWRLCTFRITCRLALGLPIGALPLADALRIVHCVTEYFKVRLHKHIHGTNK